MAVLWMDDPSFWAVGQIATRYPIASSSLSLTAGRFGGTAFLLAATAGGYTTQLASSIATGTIGISVFTGAINSNQTLIAFLDSGTLQCDLRINSTGNLLVTRNGTVLATSTNSWVNSAWHRVEFQLTVSATVGSIEVRVDGVSWIGPTGGLNTKNTANATFNQCRIQSISSTCYANDFVVTDSNSPNAGFLGDVRCYLRQPTSNSSVSWTPTWAGFLNNHAYVLGESFKDSNGNVERCTTAGTSAASGTPTWATTGGNTTTSGGATFTVVGTGANPGATNWMAVNEPGGILGGETDGDSSYNTDSTPGDVDLFGLPNLPAGANNVIAINNIIYCRKDDAGTRTIANEMSSGGTVVNGANLPLSTSYVFNDLIENTDPHTSAAWTVAAANALLVGYKEIA